FHGEIRIDDGARMHGRNLRIENVDAFEEERTLFWKEDRKALVRRNDKLVGFNLRKVGIEREIQGHIWSDRVLAGQARIKLDRLAEQTGGIDGPAFSGFR